MNLLAGAKTQSNPESCVGVLALGGKVPKMLVTPTPDLGKVLNSIHAVHMDGHVNLAAGVQARRGRGIERRGGGTRGAPPKPSASPRPTHGDALTRPRGRPPLPPRACRLRCLR